MRNGGGSCEPWDIDNHSRVWKGEILRTDSVRGAANLKTFNTSLRLNQGASQAIQPGTASAAAGPPAADGGGGTDAQAIELTRKITAMEAQIEELEQRNANLEESLQLSIPNSPLSLTISSNSPHLSQVISPALMMRKRNRAPAPGVVFCPAFKNMFR